MTSHEDNPLNEKPTFIKQLIILSIGTLLLFIIAFCLMCAQSDQCTFLGFAQENGYLFIAAFLIMLTTAASKRMVAVWRFRKNRGRREK